MNVENKKRVHSISLKKVNIEQVKYVEKWILKSILYLNSVKSWKFLVNYRKNKRLKNYIKWNFNVSR